MNNNSQNSATDTLHLDDEEYEYLNYSKLL